jgi:hypothetical protein
MGPSSAGAGFAFAALRHDRLELLNDETMNDDTPDSPLQQEARLWQDENWTAQVIKNEDDDGWAVAMFKTGESEPALVGPWTMGRDKKNPKPLDGTAFITLVKTASEFVRRSEQQLHAQLNQSVIVNGTNSRVTVLLRIVPDEDNPYAVLSAQDEGGDELAEVKVGAGFKLNRQTAQAWVDADFAKPGSGRR